MLTSVWIFPILFEGADKENLFFNNQNLDQYQYLGNCLSTPTLTQQWLIDNKLGFM